MTAITSIHTLIKHQEKYAFLDYVRERAQAFGNPGKTSINVQGAWVIAMAELYNTGLRTKRIPHAIDVMSRRQKDLWSAAGKKGNETSGAALARARAKENGQPFPLTGAAKARHEARMRRLIDQEREEGGV